MSASQADNGVVVAQRGFDFYRLNRRGKLLNKPFTTAFRTNPILPAYQGPFSPEISPDEKTIAYTYSFTASYFDYRCQCNVIERTMNTSYTWSNRFTDWRRQDLRVHPLPLQRRVHHVAAEVEQMLGRRQCRPVVDPRGA